LTVYNLASRLSEPDGGEGDEAGQGFGRSNSSVENRPVRSCGTRSSSLPTRVISVRS
jgi:hypothetical protein